MIGYFKDLILNIFIIFTPLVFYPYIHKTKSRILLYRFLLYILFSIAIISTMSVPIHLNGLIYDFRSIPIGSRFFVWRAAGFPFVVSYCLFMPLFFGEP